MPFTSSVRVPGYHAERLFDNLLRFRKAWSRYHRPDDVRHLLGLFPRVTLESGYELDYLPMGGTPAIWVWPFVRRVGTREEDLPELLADVDRDRLAGMRASEVGRKIEAGTLYRFLTYEKTPIGVCEYAVFVNELWATKSAAKASDWLEMEPVFSRRVFDEILRRSSGHLQRVARPESFDPTVQLSGQGGGEVTFLVHPSGGYRRISELRLVVEPGGSVRREAGKVIANLV